MMELLLIISVGLILAFVSMLILWETEARTQERLRLAIEAARRERDCRTPLLLHPPRRRAPPWIGNAACQFNAHSAYLRCAVNPMGPCEGCPHYQHQPLSAPEYRGRSQEICLIYPHLCIPEDSG
ncbi:DUF6464 family protein [Neosynechococcus sphagnicola]|uniref:DUF6464 family protein n=1 Tax=Neosynechococcus sphagnicola TaxID=1501145 RepID=UPI0012E04379|nr:DUF6464 family protein [Neosynechococcus sphagnicola]